MIIMGEFFGEFIIGPSKDYEKNTFITQLEDCLYSARSNHLAPMTF